MQELERNQSRIVLNVVLEWYCVVLVRAKIGRHSGVARSFQNVMESGKSRKMEHQGEEINDTTSLQPRR